MTEYQYEAYVEWRMTTEYQNPRNKNILKCPFVNERPTWIYVVRNPVFCYEKPKLNGLELRLVLVICAVLGHVLQCNVLRNHHSERQPQMSLSSMCVGLFIVVISEE